MSPDRSRTQSFGPQAPCDQNQLSLAAIKPPSPGHEDHAVENGPFRRSLTRYIHLCIRTVSESKAHMVQAIPAEGEGGKEVRGRAAELQDIRGEDRELVDGPMRIKAFVVQKERGFSFDH